jgi:hypothetical protein
VERCLGRVFNRGSIFFCKSGSGFDPEIADRFSFENRQSIFPEWILIAIVIAIEIYCSGEIIRTW